MAAPTPLAPLAYAYAHETTQATTGYFSCVPPAGLDARAALARLEAAPMDDFLHLHLLRGLAGKSAAELEALAASCRDAVSGAFTRPVLAALLAERALLAGGGPVPGFPADAWERLAPYSPAIYLRAAARPDHGAAAAWSALFRANICGHHPLPVPEDAGIPALFTEEYLRELGEALRAGTGMLQRLHAAMAADARPVWERPAPQETFLRALDALMEAGVVEGPEMRHEASLSPIALLRSWRVEVSVDCGRLRHTLRGTATAYGRGLSLAAARASYAMEMAERASAYASVGRESSCAGAEGEVLGRRHALPLTRARFSALRARGVAALDPSTLPLEAPYADEPLHWLPASDSGGAPVLVPAQAVLLFCNLDEPAFFQAAGSTGLASGNTMDEAAVAALTEIVERDAEATTPFARSRCFTLASRDGRIQSLLDDYARCGIRVQFQDLTTETGVPAYQCFVYGEGGQVARATAANLCGPRAALAALTEVPWPYSTAPGSLPRPSAPGLARLPVRVLEDLPDLRLPSPRASRRLLEAVLTAQGRPPLYVDLTRADLAIPVVRALVPGLALSAEWDRFSRPNARLFARYAASLAQGA